MMTLRTTTKRGHQIYNSFTSSPWHTDAFVGHLHKQHASIREDYYNWTHEEENASFGMTAELFLAMKLRSFVQPEGKVPPQKMHRSIPLALMEMLCHQRLLLCSWCKFNLRLTRKHVLWWCPLTQKDGHQHQQQHCLGQKMTIALMIVPKH